MAYTKGVACRRRKKHPARCKRLPGAGERGLTEDRAENSSTPFCALCLPRTEVWVSQDHSRRTGIQRAHGRGGTGPRSKRPPTKAVGGQTRPFPPLPKPAPPHGTHTLFPGYPCSTCVNPPVFGQILSCSTVVPNLPKTGGGNCC